MVQISHMVVQDQVDYHWETDQTCLEKQFTSIAVGSGQTRSTIAASRHLMFYIEKILFFSDVVFAFPDPGSKRYLRFTRLLPSEPTATRGQTLSPEGPTRQPAMSWLFSSTGITSGEKNNNKRTHYNYKYIVQNLILEIPPVWLFTTSLMALNWGAAVATAKREQT